MMVRQRRYFDLKSEPNRHPRQIDVATRLLPVAAMFPTLPIFSVVSQPFKRSQFGLYQGKTKQYGNNVPFSKHKTRRTWLPNVQRKRFPSEALGEDIRVKVTTRALRTIKKVCRVFNACMKIKVRHHLVRRYRQLCGEIQRQSSWT